jgi:hypothetical protein
MEKPMFSTTRQFHDTLLNRSNRKTVSLNYPRHNYS